MPRKESAQFVQRKAGVSGSRPDNNQNGAISYLYSEAYAGLARKPKKKEAVVRQRLLLAGRFVLDLALISLAFVLAYFIRYVLQWGADVLEQNQVALSDYLPILFGYCAI